MRPAAARGLGASGGRVGRRAEEAGAGRREPLAWRRLPFLIPLPAQSTWMAPADACYARLGAAEPFLALSIGVGPALIGLAVIVIAVLRRFEV